MHQAQKQLIVPSLGNPRTDSKAVPQGGAVLLDGIDVRELQQGSLRGAVAVVPQVQGPSSLSSQLRLMTCGDVHLEAWEVVMLVIMVIPAQATSSLCRIQCYLLTQ